MWIFILIMSNIVNLVLGFILQPWMELSFRTINGKTMENYEILESEIETYMALGWATVVVYIAIFIFFNIIFLKLSKLKFFKYIKYNWIAFAVGIIVSVIGRVL
ncbi:hypothetical protein [Fusobacterium sp. THCT1E2]